MSDKHNLTQALKAAVLPNEMGFAKVCTVDSVDMSANTCYCIPINDDADMQEVRLIAQQSNGFLLIPKVGSVVVVSMLSDSSFFVSMFSDIDEINLNGKNFDGLVKIGPLVNKVNAIENLVNSILNTLKTTTIPLAPSGTYPFAPLYASLNDIAPLTQKSDLENTTVKQGDGS